jgi:hypothetical protein
VNLSPDIIKLVFGLKVNQYRHDKSLSFAELSKKSGLSASYLNEIEKGKKYPKTDKIMQLADALEVTYDELVSLKLGNQLGSVSDLITSNFLSEVPFDFFGIDPKSLLEMLVNAPAKVSAFIRTVVGIGRNYNLSVEQFYFAVLRSYQELHQNAFPDLEKAAESFFNEYKVNESVTFDEFFLTNLLADKYGVSIDFYSEEEHPNLSNIRSIFQREKNTLMLNSKTSSKQRVFTILREIGFLYLNLKERPITSSWVEVNSFDEVLNNFKASYFAGSVLIPRSVLKEEMHHFFSQPTWQPDLVNQMLDKFAVTPETLLHRMSNILNEQFGISDFYFFRFEATRGKKDFRLTKEMHMSDRKDIYANQSEHYCRRWLAFKTIDDVDFQLEKDTYSQPIVEVQRSTYHGTGRNFLLITMSRPLNIQSDKIESVSVGFELNDALKSKILFHNDSAIPNRVVNHTCERCGIFDCQERVAAPILLQKERHLKDMKAAIAELG